jgi:hypothetical protein
MQYAALIRPAIDRVYSSMRRAAAPMVREAVRHCGPRPGLLLDFHFGLLARPMPAAAFAAVTTYSGGDGSTERSGGLATVDGDGAWALTEAGTHMALAIQRAIGEGAQEHWGQTPIATMPGATALPELADLLGRLLDAGAASGGPAFAAMAPVYEPHDASPALQVSTRLGALRHHRADAHRAAWQGAGLTLPELLALPAGPQRDAIEAETNRLDSPIYDALTEAQRWKLLAILAWLP